MEIILEGGLELQEQADPVTPAAGYVRLYGKNKSIWQKNSDGTTSDLAGGGGAGASKSFGFFMS